MAKFLERVSYRYFAHQPSNDELETLAERGWLKAVSKSRGELRKFEDADILLSVANLFDEWDVGSVFVLPSESGRYQEAWMLLGRIRSNGQYEWAVDILASWPKQEDPLAI